MGGTIARLRAARGKGESQGPERANAPEVGFGAHRRIPAMHVQIVYVVNQTLAQETFETEDVAAAMAQRGWTPSGREGGQHLRTELRGHPSFMGLCGPMWGGHTGPDEAPVIRYETIEAYKDISGGD
jgi:hypothetical protein